MKYLNRLKNAPSSSPRLDWIVALTSICFVTGVFTDGWAHNHIPELETFFTPWHALLYSGFFAMALTIGVAWLYRYRQGYHWRHALPPGYNIAAVGSIIFILGGLCDLGWHQLFGIESDIDALLSPTHLVLAIGGALTVTAPLRSALAQHKPVKHILAELPAVLSLTAALCIVGFMTMYVHPVVHPWLAISQQTSKAFYGLALGRAGSPVYKRRFWVVGGGNRVKVFHKVPSNYS